MRWQEITLPKGQLVRMEHFEMREPAINRRITVEEYPNGNFVAFDETRQKFASGASIDDALAAFVKLVAK